MINQQLLEYVRSQKAAGLSKEAITQALAAGGWTAQDVNEAFMAIEGVRTPPSPPAAPSASMPAQTLPVQPAGPRVIVPPPSAQLPRDGVQPSVPPTMPAPAQRPVLATSEFSTAPAALKKKRGAGTWIAALLILVFVIIGLFGLLAYLNPALVASYIPAVEMFFPAPEPAQTQEPADTNPPESSTILLPDEGTLDASTTASTSPFQ
jgi:hypothetical protein